MASKEIFEAPKIFGGVKLRSDRVMIAQEQLKSRLTGVKCANVTL